MCGSMVDIQSASAEIRRGIKKLIEDRKKAQGKNIMSASAMQGGHNKYDNDFWLYYTKKTTKLLLFSILRHNLLKFITQTGLHCRNYF